MRDEIFGEICEAVKKAVGADCDVWFGEVNKNNGVARQAIIIREPGKTNAMQIYIDEMLKVLGESDIYFQDIVDEIADTYRNHKDAYSFQNITSGISREMILGNAVCRLVNAERNEKRLKIVPNKKVLDLAVIYSMIVDENEHGTASLIVNNAMCTMYGISFEELDAAAIANTKIRGFNASTISDILAELTGNDAKDCAADELGMYVITNEARFNGANVMLFPEELEKIAVLLDDDLYILPSSIHEVIAVPVTCMNPYELAAMVSEINDKEVSDDEFLSDNVYRYSRADGGLRIAYEWGRQDEQAV